MRKAFSEGAARRGAAGRVAAFSFTCAPERFFFPTPMRIVLKFGSGILANPKGNDLETKQFWRFAAEVSEQVAAGHQCIIVSSGAVAAGLSALKLKERPESLSARQACAAV